MASGEHEDAALLVDTLHGWSRAAPALLAARALQERRDWKFAVPLADVSRLLAPLAGAFSVLWTAESPLASYRSTYLDTPALDLYHHHRRGLPRRWKVRFRDYLDRRLTMLEAKERKGRGDTHKHRWEVPWGSREIPDSVVAFLTERSVPGPLRRTVETAYRRVTLIGQDVDERVTVDLDLTLSAGDRVEHLPGVALIEVKASGPVATARTALLRAGVRSLRVSKYCVAVARLGLSPQVDRFLLPLRALDRLQTP